MFEHVVAVRKALAEDHPDQLISQHELARAYDADGRVNEAIKLLEHVVSVESRSLREDHPSRLLTLELLADCRAELDETSRTSSLSSSTTSFPSPDPSLAERRQVPDPGPSQHATTSVAPRQQYPSNSVIAEPATQQSAGTIRETSALESQRRLRTSLGKLRIWPQKRKEG
ncbi:tetratricopeptide repeat-containing protein 10 [Elsinoe australis]|uniref:Tetratricopeptide repeat-containing protein 10 n=1 Tax=Elsinoe australis TaxID=40998 RepID=A0A4U7AZ40_9PEZI|nr:tetratricopeptide repeat-containing protein 10 [Elsinoe australis]